MENVDYLENCYRYSNFEQILDPLGAIALVYNSFEKKFYFPNSGRHLEFCQKLKMSHFRITDFSIWILYIGSRTSNEKTTCRKSCPANLLQVSNLIFDTCFKVQLGHHYEEAFYLLWYRYMDIEPFLWSNYLCFCLIPGRS